MIFVFKKILPKQKIGETLFIMLQKNFKKFLDLVIDWEIIVIATRIPLLQYIKINIVCKVLSNYLNKIV